MMRLDGRGLREGLLILGILSTSALIKTIAVKGIKTKINLMVSNL